MAKKTKTESQKSMTNMGRGFIKLMDIPKGSFGKTFKTLDGFNKSHNRHVNKLHRDKLVASWEPPRAGLCTLLVIDAHTFYIVDGQHRISAASILGDQKLLCEIYSEENIPYGNLQDWITALNTQTKTFRTHDHLRVHQDNSYWPMVFDQHGLDPQYSTSSKVLTWTSIIRAYAMGTKMMKEGVYHKSGRYPLERLLHLWLMTQPDEIERAAGWYQWWGPVVREAHKRKITGFAGYRPGSIMYMMWCENADHNIEALQQVPQRLFYAPEIQSLHLMANASTAPTAELLLRCANHNARTRLVTLLGSTGRG